MALRVGGWEGCLKEGALRRNSGKFVWKKKEERGPRQRGSHWQLWEGECEVEDTQG